MSTARISTCLSALRDIIIISKFCCGVRSENFLVSFYHLLNLSSDRNHFLLSKIISSCLRQIKRKKCQQSIAPRLFAGSAAKYKCTNAVVKLEHWNDVTVTTVMRLGSIFALWSEPRNWPEELAKADKGRNAARKRRAMSVLKSALTGQWHHGG